LQMYSIYDFIQTFFNFISGQITNQLQEVVQH